MIMSTCDLLFRDLDRSCVVSINWVSVQIMCSRSLQHIEVREMGR